MSRAGLRDERVAQNLDVAKRFFDGYHGALGRGELTGVFDEADFAAEWVFASPFLRGEHQQVPGPGLGLGAATNHAFIWQRIPDYRMEDFDAWPTDWGCAWRWRVTGEGIDGRRHEFWEQLFTWNDEAGKITRFEFYDDWHGFPQTLAYAYDTTIASLFGFDGYGSAPWMPGDVAEISTPRQPRQVDEDTPGRVAANLATAHKLRDRTVQELEFADGWQLFSPWFGEVAVGRDVDHDRAWELATKGALRRQVGAPDSFATWPTDEGGAFRWRFGLDGPSGGARYESWEQVFFHTDAAGRINRMEVFDDWHGFPQLAGHVTGLDVDQLWDAERYVAWAGHA